MNKFRRVKNFFFRPKLSPEVFEAGYFRIPDVIDVQWTREGKIIVGKVKAGDKEFFTQGESPEDFIEMVNDSIYTVFEIPFDYIDAIRQSKAFVPSEKDLLTLCNGSIPKSYLSMSKNREVQVA